MTNYHILGRGNEKVNHDTNQSFRILSIRPLIHASVDILLYGKFSWELNLAVGSLLHDRHINRIYTSGNPVPNCQF